MNLRKHFHLECPARYSTMLIIMVSGRKGWYYFYICTLSSCLLTHSLSPPPLDIVTRLPSHDNYSSPPGTLVFIDSAFNITLYPPNPMSNEPVPIRPISFLHLSGLLNRHIIARLVSDSLVRIILRVVFPFFVNDHFPSDYCEALRKGKINWVIIGEGGISGGDETDVGNILTPLKKLNPEQSSRRLNVMVGSNGKRDSWPPPAR